LIPISRADLQSKSTVQRKNRLRADGKQRLRPGLKHDGIIRDRKNPEHEFGLVECSPLQSAGECSRKWLGDVKKVRRPMRDMLGQLILAVNYNRKEVDELQVFAFCFSALTVQVLRMTQHQGYLFLLSREQSLSVPQNIEQFRDFLMVLCHILQITVFTWPPPIRTGMKHRLII
jgi:hypothetical protein